MGNSTSSASSVERLPLRILYATLSNTSKKFAERLQQEILESAHAYKFEVKLIDLLVIDLDDLITSQNDPCLNLYVIPSYNVETGLDSVLWELEEASNDFRVGSAAMHNVWFGVLGIGHKEWMVTDEYCLMAHKLDEYLDQLGAKRILSVGEVDTAEDPERDYERWSEQMLTLLQVDDLSQLFKVSNKSDRLADNSESESDELSTPSSSESLPVAKTAAQMKALAAKKKARQRKRAQDGIQVKAGSDDEADIEDLGKTLHKVQLSREAEAKKGSNEPKEMISSLTRKALTKQGYALIGSHSGVKTCRWTKAALRGRGFCYKHAFYGIMSHRCMETTPSLACSNKCTFCWRSHTNPVGTSWRWATDPPQEIVSGALAEHDRLIKQLRGMPDVRSDRFEEARTPRHAALSLVGEPIIYPHIKEYIRLLHEKHISTFMVTNAQFPEPMRDLPPVTQLYLSIDAGDKISLKQVDRPLHRDFWERLLECVDIVRTKNIRTVFRLTLVKEFNDGEIEGYKELIKRGRPDFIEVKGVTYCGYGGSSGLSIKNSPFHEEVVRFVETLVAAIKEDGEAGDYGIAAEHAHSCCVLAASKRFYQGGQWKTWIDYDRFFELLESGKEFDALDYTAALPPWAEFGSAEAGFSPEDIRFHRRPKRI